MCGTAGKQRFWCQQCLFVMFGRTTCHVHLLFMSLPCCELCLQPYVQILQDEVLMKKHLWRLRNIHWIFFFYFKAISLSHYLCILASLPVLCCAKWVLLTPASALEESKKERTGWWEGSFHYSLSLSGDLFKFTLDVIHRESGGVFLSLTLCVEVSVEDQEVTDSQGWKLAVQLIEVS